MQSERFIHKNTRTLHDIPGGIHPEENKWQSTQDPIRQPRLPKTLIVPLQQHAGKPAKILVKAGESVLKGQLIAESDGVISANVHASSSGTVREIAEHSIAHPSGLAAECIVIDTDGKDTWCSLTQHEDYLNLPRETVLEVVRGAGIAGMGGAGFPTDVKLHPANLKQLNTLIINGIECEPYITADDMLMRSYADEVLRGIEIMARLLEPKNVVLAIEDNKPHAFEAIQAALEERSSHTTAAKYDVELAVIPTKYPSGGEKQLIQILTGQEVPSGGIPADIGIVCQNVATARAVYRAVRYGEPLISRITTLSGEAIGQPCNVEVLIGTPISHLLNEFDYQPARHPRLIIGGPMMGYTVEDANTPVVKTTNCILAPEVNELPLSEHAQACIRCGLCTEACPAELLPQQLYWFSRSGEYEKAEHHNLFDCIECGACAYVCPSSIPLVQYYRHAKGEIKEQRLETEKSDRARIRFEARQERLEREAQEKEAKRKARADAAAKMQAEKASLATAQNADTPSGKANNTATQDPKKAAIEAALARKQANTEAAPTLATSAEPEKSIDELKELFEKAQLKLDKMIDALEDAKANAPDNVAKLQRAVEKNQLRVNQAKQNYEKARKVAENNQPSASPATSSTALQPSLEELHVHLEKAQNKLEKMEEALKEAKSNTPDAIEKLQRAVTKNKVRVAAAQEAYDHVLKQQQETN